MVSDKRYNSAQLPCYRLRHRREILVFNFVFNFQFQEKVMEAVAILAPRPL